MRKTLVFTLISFYLLSCTENAGRKVILLDTKKFSTVINEKNVCLLTLESGNGLYAQLTNYGSRVVALWAPDKTGHYEDLILGYDNINSYIDNNDEHLFGAVSAYYKEQAQPRNFKPLDQVVWDIDKISRNEIVFSYRYDTTETYFSNTARFRISYTLTPDNEFRIKSEIDKPEIINLSNHILLNLKGQGNGNIDDHILTVNSDSYTTSQNKHSIPVDNTPFDFRFPACIGRNSDTNNVSGDLYYWIISKKQKNSIEHIATLHEPASGRLMEFWSDQSGLRLYKGDRLNGKFTGKYNKPLNYREAMAFDTFWLPDETPARDKIYTHTCIYRFLTR